MQRALDTAETARNHFEASASVSPLCRRSYDGVLVASLSGQGDRGKGPFEEKGAM